MASDTVRFARRAVLGNQKSRTVVLGLRRAESPGGSEMSKNIGVGLISFAHGHQIGWSDVFSKREDARVVAVWDDDEARGRQQAERLGGALCAPVGRCCSPPGTTSMPSRSASENAKHAEARMQGRPSRQAHHDAKAHGDVRGRGNGRSWRRVQQERASPTCKRTTSDLTRCTSR